MEERAKTEIARAVRNARIHAGLTQMELADAAETTQAVIGRIESGTDSRVPSLGFEGCTHLVRAAGSPSKCFNN
jgi:DNA-binding XRE family transcriptional regulator